MNAAGNNNKTELNDALRCAIEHLHTETVRFLLANGADVNARDEFGQTPLHLALDIEAEHSKYEFDVNKIVVPTSTEISRIIIEAGADVNAKTSTGETPLDWAVASGHAAGEKMLRERGAT